MEWTRAFNSSLKNESQGRGEEADVKPIIWIIFYKYIQGLRW